MSANGGDLEVVFDDAPSDELVALLRTHKADVLEFLIQSETAEQKEVPLQKLKHSCAPLSLGQQRLWFLDKLETSSAHYNITKALRLSGELNTVHLNTSLEAIIRRHEILRTIYVEDSEVKQLVQENQTLDFAEVDLSYVGNIDQALEDLINA